MGWDANIVETEFVGKKPRQSFNGLIEAINQKCLTTGQATLSTFSKYELTGNFFSTFQAKITTLIPLFADHTQAVAGSFEGMASIPTWNETSILALCDVTERIPAPTSKKCAKWCWQQYQILNLLRWHRQTTVTPFEVYRRTGEGDEFISSGYSAAVTEAQNNWNANSWNANSGLYLYDSYGYIYLNRYIVRLEKTVGKIKAENPAYASIQCSADIYFSPSHSTTSDPTRDYQYYNPEGWLESKFVRIKTISENSNQWQESDEIGNRGMPAYVPEPISPITYRLYESFLTAVSPNTRCFILKFDGANGYTYKDW